MHDVQPITLIEFPEYEALPIEAEFGAPDGGWIADIEGYVLFDPDTADVKDVALIVKAYGKPDRIRVFARHDTIPMQVVREVLWDRARETDVTDRIEDIVAERNPKPRFDPVREWGTHWGRP